MSGHMEPQELFPKINNYEPDTEVEYLLLRIRVAKGWAYFRKIGTKSLTKKQQELWHNFVAMSIAKVHYEFVNNIIHEPQRTKGRTQKKKVQNTVVKKAKSNDGL